MPNQWFLRLDSSSNYVTGPLSDTELLRLASVGSVVPSTLVSLNEPSTWRPASQIKGFFERVRRQVDNERSALPSITSVPIPAHLKPSKFLADKPPSGAIVYPLSESAAKSTFPASTLTGTRKDAESESAVSQPAIIERNRVSEESQALIAHMLERVDRLASLCDEFIQSQRRNIEAQTRERADLNESLNEHFTQLHKRIAGLDVQLLDIERRIRILNEDPHGVFDENPERNRTHLMLAALRENAQESSRQLTGIENRLEERVEEFEVLKAWVEKRIAEFAEAQRTLAERQIDRSFLDKEIDVNVAEIHVSGFQFITRDSATPFLQGDAVPGNHVFQIETNGFVYEVERNPNSAQPSHGVETELRASGALYYVSAGAQPWRSELVSEFSQVGVEVSEFAGSAPSTSNEDAEVAEQRPNASTESLSVQRSRGESIATLDSPGLKIVGTNDITNDVAFSARDAERNSDQAIATEKCPESARLAEPRSRSYADARDDQENAAQEDRSSTIEDRIDRYDEAENPEEMRRAIQERSHADLPSDEKFDVVYETDSAVRPLAVLRGDLLDYHQDLIDRFAKPAKENALRRRSVYFLDHGLQAAAVTEIKSLVREALRRYPVTDDWWTQRHFPLLILSVETGYEYAGNGTDFWPTFERVVGRELSHESRRRITSWFETAAHRFDAVTPTESDWDRYFRHIAWPITHAVVAKDIRRAFADNLRKYDGGAADDDDTVILKFSESPSLLDSPRFRTWLKRRDLVAGLVRDLLGGETLEEVGMFSVALRARLIDDLRAEPDIQGAVLTVMRRLNVTTSTSVDRAVNPEAKSLTSPLDGEFCLRRDVKGKFELFGVLPEMPKTVRKDLESFRRLRPVRPWGLADAAPLPSDALRSARGIFRLRLSSVSRAADGRPFFLGFEGLKLALETERWLRAVCFPASEKMAFSPALDDDDVSYAITERIPNCGPVWVLTKTGMEWPNVKRHLVEESRETDIHEVEASDPAFRQWFGWPKVDSLDDGKELLRWIHPTPIGIDLSGRPIFSRTDDIGLANNADDSVLLVLRCGGNTVERRYVDHVALVTCELPGEYELEIVRAEETLRKLSFIVQDSANPEVRAPTPWRCVLSHVNAGSHELTRRDFFNRRLMLEIECDRAIEDLILVVSIHPGAVSHRLVLPRLPAKLPTAHPLWSDLLGGLPEDVVSSSCDLTIRAEIGGVTSDSWTINAEILNLWWETGEDGLPVALNDGHRFAVRHECLLTGKVIERPEAGDPCISIAVDELGNDFVFEARISVSEYSYLRRQPIRPKRLLRRMNDEGHSAGLRTIAGRYLRLACGSSSSSAAEMNRVGLTRTTRDWLLEILCGPAWATKSCLLDEALESGSVGIWWTCFRAHPEMVLPLRERGNALPDTLTDAECRQFAAALPQGWCDGEPPIIGVDDLGALEDAFHSLLGEEIFLDMALFVKSLSEANELVCGGPLADTLIPPHAGDELLSWTISESSTEALAVSLMDWSQRHMEQGRGRESWTTGELQIWLDLLLYPERLRTRAWLPVLEKLLNDRPIARAGAFVAWRVMQASGFEHVG